MERTETTPLSPQGKWTDFGTNATIQERLEATELEYFSANHTASYALSVTKGWFFDVDPETEPNTIAQTYRDKATRFIIAIKENDLDSLTKPFTVKPGQKTLTTISPPISQETLDDLKKVCKSLQYRQKLLEWLQKISNATNERTVYAINTASDTHQYAFFQVLKLIGTNLEQLKKENDPIKAQIEFLKNVFKNITNYKDGNGPFLDGEQYDKINNYLKDMKIESPHLFLKLGVLLCKEINPLLKLYKTYPNLLSELKIQMQPYMIYLHNITIADSVPSYIKDDINQKKSFALAKNLIYNLYNDNTYGPYTIKMLFEILAISKDINYSIEKLAKHLPQTEDVTATDRTDILSGVRRSHFDTDRPTYSNYDRASYTTPGDQNTTIPLDVFASFAEKENPLLKSTPPTPTKPTPNIMFTGNKEVSENLQTLSQCLLNISSNQRSKLKTWVETGLMLDEPDKTNDMNNITIFFQDYILSEISRLSNKLGVKKAGATGPSITAKEIGKLQSAKLGIADVPKGQEEVVKNLTDIFNYPTFQRFLARTHKTIIYVIDSVQYSTSINEENGSSWLNPHHSEILPPIQYNEEDDNAALKAKEQEQTLAYAKAIREGFDPNFYYILIKNYKVMTSIRNICRHTGEFDKIFSNLIGNTFGANYPTDETTDVKNMLSSMTTKEFFGAGYNALAMASIYPKRYHVEDSDTDEDSDHAGDINNHGTHIQNVKLEDNNKLGDESSSEEPSGEQIIFGGKTKYKKQQTHDQKAATPPTTPVAIISASSSNLVTSHDKPEQFIQNDESGNDTRDEEENSDEQIILLDTTQDNPASKAVQDTTKQPEVPPAATPDHLKQVKRRLFENSNEYDNTKWV